MRDHSSKNWGPHWFISFICTTPFDQITWSSFIILSLVHNLLPKIKDLINLIFFLVHDHSAKVRGHSYFLIYYFFNCANISFAILKAVLPLYFVRSIHRDAALTLIFRTLYSWKCCSYISYAESMAIWSLGHSYLGILFAARKNDEIWGMKWLVFFRLYNFLMCIL